MNSHDVFAILYESMISMFNQAKLRFIVQLMDSKYLKMDLNQNCLSTMNLFIDSKFNLVSIQNSEEFASSPTLGENFSMSEGLYPQRSG